MSESARRETTLADIGPAGALGPISFSRARFRPSGPVGRFLLKLSSCAFLGLLAAILWAGVAQAACPPTCGPFTSGAVPGAQQYLQPMQYQEISNGMGTAAVQIFYGGTVCAAGCTATGSAGLASGNYSPAVFVGLANWCTTAQTATSVLVCDDVSACVAGTNTVIWQSGPFGSGQTVTFPYGGIYLSKGLVVVLQAAEASNCFFAVLYR